MISDTVLQFVAQATDESPDAAHEAANLLAPCCAGYAVVMLIALGIGITVLVLLIRFLWRRGKK